MTKTDLGMGVTRLIQTSDIDFEDLGGSASELRNADAEAIASSLRS